MRSQRLDKRKLKLAAPIGVSVRNEKRRIMIPDIVNLRTVMYCLMTRLGSLALSAPTEINY
jgi:hypothetical protein